MTTITKGATTITPSIVLGYEAKSESGNIVHQLVNGSVAVSLAPDTLRSGTLGLLFESRSDAFAAYASHVESGVFTLTDSAVSEIGMNYVRQGAMAITLEEETRDLWILSIDFQEVP